MGGEGGALGGAGGFGGAELDPPGFGGELETPGGGGGSGNFSPQLEQTSSSKGFVVPHLGHFFSVFFADEGLKHMYAPHFYVEICKRQG